ncbi:hypothetical protein FSP39_023391 [Pinctada imbricata]|uniref:DUF7153 domain-containing protein n=1 Tax=Pinctada imbricata TaxID=66713 RepID=A0AA89C4D5_PINIB|nr:hypothetical protein FSP39_023391 [Pinctada imbricata]
MVFKEEGLYCTSLGEMLTMSSLPNYHIQAKVIVYKDEASFKQNWKGKAETNVKEATFLEGILLKSLIPGTNHYVDYSVFYAGVHEENRGSTNGGVINPLTKVLHIQNHSYSTEITAGRKAQEGFYDEIQCILRKGVRQLPRTPVSKDSVYILIGFHSFEETKTLEKRWKCWSGADCILWNCPTELNLRRVTFLKHTTDSDEFSYFCLGECEEGLNYLNLALDFMETLRLRHCGLVGLYKVERYYIPPQRAQNLTKPPS